MKIGMIAFPRMTRLDLTGPYEVFSRMPGARMTKIAKRSL